MTFSCPTCGREYDLQRVRYQDVNWSSRYQPQPRRYQSFETPYLKRQSAGRSYSSSLLSQGAYNPNCGYQTPNKGTSGSKVDYSCM